MTIRSILTIIIKYFYIFKILFIKSHFKFNSVKSFQLKSSVANIELLRFRGSFIHIKEYFNVSFILLKYLN